ncbi:MAG: DUF99 family protein [Petrotogales bacterium]
MTSVENLVLLGVEDGSFDAFKRNGNALLCCTCMKRNIVIDVLFSWIKIDGIDATEKLLEILKNTETDVILLGGISYAGFNLIDAKKIYEITDIPLIIYSGKKPDTLSVKRALRLNFSDWELRWSIVKNLGRIYSFISKDDCPPIYFEAIGIDKNDCESILRYSADLCRIPEPVRVASIIAKGIK